jgi:hypothetical protein
VCLSNTGYEASLERLKIYEVLSDRTAATHRQIRVIDESGEDYLYPKEFFVPIDVPQAIRRAVLGTRDLSRRSGKAKTLFVRARKYIGAVKGPLKPKNTGAQNEGIGPWNRFRKTKICVAKM